MYEEKTYDAILEEMLDNVPDTIDKREGSVIYDALAPIAIEVAQVYQDMDMMLEETFADTASYYYMVKRAAERGILPNEGTEAILEIVVTPEDTEIELGTEFNIGDLKYTLTQSLSEGHHLIKCEEAGTEGNNTSDEVVPLETIEDLESIEIYAIYEAGTDDEDVESLRERYMESFNVTAFGGNKADYKAKIKDISGVGGCKVYSAQDLLEQGETETAGRVKCVISTTSGGVPSSDLIESVQETMDPTQDGLGDGLAPIGHIVTIEGVTAVTINISGTFTLDSNYEWADISSTVSEVIEAYLNELAEEWDEYDNLTVRISQLEIRILSVEGIVDIEDVSINGSEKNYSCAADEVPIMGEVSNG